MKRGVILLNMGGANSLEEVPLFLRNMFNDKRIIPAPKPIRKMIAWWIVTKRSAYAQEHYKLLGGKSPLTEISRSLAEKLEEAIGLPVRLGMRYVPPFTREAVQELVETGVEEIVALPLYPQYSTTTTLSSLEDLEALAEEAGFAGTIRTVERFYEHRTYNQVVAERVKEALKGDDAGTFHLVFSAHALPQRVIDKGDPYQAQCQAHTALICEILEEMGMRFKQVHLGYQSKVGRMQWTEPALGDVLKGIGKENVLLVPLSFTVDNLETVYELEMEYREEADALQIPDYRVVACPNDHPLFIQALSELIS